MFELLTLSRVLRVLRAAPRHIRWLSASNGNLIRVDDVTAEYEKTWARDRLLKGSAYGDGLRAAIEEFGVSIPERADLFVSLPAAAPLEGILIECKSGGQQFSAGVEQLRAYRAALPRPGRYLLWAVVQRPKGGPPTDQQVDFLRRSAREAGDTWAFSGPDEATIRAVLDSCLGPWLEQRREAATPRTFTT
jgi:hypothetical protein